MSETIDPWELLREARESGVFEKVTVLTASRLQLSDAEKRVRDVLKRIDAALAAREAKQPAQIPTRYRKDTLCPKCEYPKTNPYKCELCSEVCSKGDK